MCTGSTRSRKRCSPRSISPMSEGSWSATSSAVVPLRTICPPWATALRREVRMTVGPNQSPSRCWASPLCSPIRTRSAPARHGSAPRDRWASTAAATPSADRSNTAATPSPRYLNTEPSWRSMTSARSTSWRARSSRMHVGAASQSFVLPSTSVNRNVRVDPPSPTGPSLAHRDPAHARCAPRHARAAPSTDQAGARTRPGRAGTRRRLRTPRETWAGRAAPVYRLGVVTVR
jgi:hypothetical protein